MVSGGVVSSRSFPEGSEGDPVSALPEWWGGEW